MTKRAIFTIVSCNYFHYAKTLMQSVRKVDLISDLFVVLVDEGYNPEHYASNVFEVINFKDIPIPQRKKMCFQYDILELNTAVKPFAIKCLFTKGYQKVVYLDPDIFVYSSLERTFCSLESYHAVVTPHLTEPLDDKFRPADLDILRAGIYNLGFFAVKPTAEVQKFIDWWADKLSDHCRVAISEGIFVDQKWCDFIPSFVSQVLVEHDPGMNVAYWNLKHREVTDQDGAYFVGSSRLIFFHFSGLGLNGLSLLSRHEDRFESLGLPITIDRLKKNYLEMLKKNQSEFYSRQPYNFDHFTNSSVKIPKAVRELYRTNRLVRAVFGSDPFDMSKDPGFQKTYNKKIYGKKNPITLLCESIYKSRPDLQAAFPNCGENDGVDLCRWFLKNANLEHGLDDIFVRVARKGLDNIAKPSAGWASLKQGLVNKVLTVAIQFTRPNHGAIQDQRTDAKLAHHCSRLAKPAVHWAYRIAKRLLGLDRCHRIREALNQSLLKSYGGKSQPKVVYARNRHKDHGLNIIGYLTAELGLGEAARATIRAATAAGISISAINFTDGCNSRMFESVGADVDKSPKHFVNLVHVNADQTLALVQGMGRHFFSDRYNIGYWMWETTEFPSKFLKSLEYFDEIWTASEFCREVLARKSLKPVVKIPHSMNMTLSKPDSQRMLGLPEGSFIFFNMVDFFSFPERKNPLGAIEAFIKAFGTASQDVRLIVKISNSSHRPEVKKIIKSRVETTKSITLIEGYMDRWSLNTLMANVDCYVSLHRSEGFGLPIAEAMSLGKPVIATGWSGNMEFMDDSNSFPVKYELTEIPLQDGPYKNAGCWAEPDCNHAAELMSYVVKNPNVAQKVGSLAKKKMLEEYSPEAIGSRMRDRLGWIQESLN
ncbi:MAG: glycosyltransferase family 4 protein [Desulfomonilaceae bacterium]|jgi:glycosyltransferase involved in cell wall biosynthesis